MLAGCRQDASRHQEVNAKALLISTHGQVMVLAAGGLGGFNFKMKSTSIPQLDCDPLEEGSHGRYFVTQLLVVVRPSYDGVEKSAIQGDLGALRPRNDQPLTTRLIELTREDVNDKTSHECVVLIFDSWDNPKRVSGAVLHCIVLDGKEMSELFESIELGADAFIAADSVSRMLERQVVGGPRSPKDSSLIQVNIATK